VLRTAEPLATPVRFQAVVPQVLERVSQATPPSTGAPEVAD
jgi:hypothetical protein